MIKRMYGKRAAAAMGSPPRGVLSPTRDGGAGAAVANAASTSAADVALTLSIVADDATDERRKRHRDDEVVEGGGGGGSTTASSITLREAGQTLALVEELTYQIDGISSREPGVAVKSVSAVARLLADTGKRAVLRAHGLCARLARTAELLGGGARAGMDADIAFGLLALAVIVFEDGALATADLRCSSALIGLAVRLVAEDSASIIAADSALVHDVVLLSSREGSAGLGAVVARAGGGSSLGGALGGGAAASSASGRGVGSRAGVGASPHRLVDTLQENLSSIGSSRMGGTQPPRALTGAISPTDLALFVISRCCVISDSGAADGASAEESNSSAAVAAKSDSTDADIARQSAASRAALRGAANGTGLRVLAALTADAARAVREMGAAAGGDTGGLGAMRAAPSLAAAAADRGARCEALLLTAGIAPRYVAAVSRLRLLLGLLEDATFLSFENVAILASIDVCVSGARQEQFVATLLGIVGAARAARAAAPPPTSADADPLLDLLSAALRVLINITHRHPPGCAAVGRAGTDVVVDVAGEFGRLAKVSAGNAIARAVRRRGSPRAADAPVEIMSAAAFDALVLALGLLANCAEEDALVRTALRAKTGGADVLCDVFAARFERMSLDFSKVQGGMQQNPAEGTSGGEAGDDTGSCETDDVVVAGYCALLLGVCARDASSEGAKLVEGVGTRVLRENVGAEAPLEAGSRAMSFALRGFVALQSAASLLTEETLGHVAAVQATLDAFTRAPVDQMQNKSTTVDELVTRGGFAKAGLSVKDWLHDE